MDARSLLQGLFLALALGASYAQGGFQWQRRPQCCRGFQPPRFFQDGSQIAFPGEPGFPAAAVNRFVEAPRLPIRALDRPSCTRGSADPSAPCEQDQDYNDNVRGLVNQLLARTRSVNEIISDPGLSVILNDSLTPPPPPSGFTPSIRFGGPRETPACVSREELIFPQRAKTPKNDWVFVVNQEGVKQALRVERCNKEGEPCNIGIPNTGDVSTFCRQKYVYRRMLVVGSNQIEPEEVLMPSCCVCYIRRNNFDIPSKRNLIPSRDRRNTFDIASRTGTSNGTNTAEAQPVDVQPPGGSAIGFINQPPPHVNHNIRRSSGGFNYHNLFQNGRH
ncbi:uncharacterized protein [Palaemon carinicauda]|uniref:uncharacterized protein isoform X2 n=1 Tax=Palaemon carinicauda TaxID=392227 RepID=UPI0035B663D0